MNKTVKIKLIKQKKKKKDSRRNTEQELGPDSEGGERRRIHATNTGALPVEDGGSTPDLGTRDFHSNLSCLAWAFKFATINSLLIS